MYQFEEQIWFWALLALPTFVLGTLLVHIWRSKVQRQFADAALFDYLSPDRSSFKSTLKLILRCLTILFLVLALVNPKIGTKLETVKREGVDIVFAVDVSKSMLAEDVAPNRLEKAKQLVSQIINNLVSDRIGIIAYAGKAFPQLPITTDYGVGKMFLQNLSTDMLSSQGTAIDQALLLAQTYYNDEAQTNRILFIVSDGEDHGEISAQEMAENLADLGIRIFTIGVGENQGVPIPIKQNGVMISYKKDQNGEVVISKRNESTLKEIAEASNGFYIDGNSTNEVVERVTDILSQMDKKEFESTEFAEFKDQFQWFLGLGILFLILDVLFLERKTAWIKRLNLFNENL
jgi:Ca-activated chloride channel family protein